MEQTPSQAEVGEGGETKSVHPSQYSRMPQAQPTSQNVAAGKSGSSFMGFDDIRQPGFWSRAVPAEFLGTFLLVFIGCGACCVLPHEFKTTRTDERSLGSGRSDPPLEVSVAASLVGITSVVRIALAFGMTVSVIAYAIGHVSGAHLNPAVSFGLIPAGMCSVMKAVIYSAAQILGGIVGAVVLYLTLDGYSQQSVGATVVASYTPRKDVEFKVYKYDPNYIGSTGYVGAILIEIFITFLLVLVVCGVCDKLKSDMKGIGGLAIGLGVVVGHLMAVTKTGASMNPARTIGPNLMAWIHYKITYIPKKDITPENQRDNDIFLDKSPGNAAMNDLWVYLLCPISGGLLAGLTYRFLFREKPKPQENQ